MIIVDYYLNEEDEQSGIFANSLVTDPANMENRLEVFNSESEYKMKENIVHAPLIVPNRLMERISPNLGLHYGRFNEKSIEKLHLQFMKSGNINRVNAQHDKDNYLDGVTLLEIYRISDRNSSELFSHLPKGTLMGSYHVDNEDLKKRIEKGEFKGFSIELKNPIRKVQEELFKSLPDDISDHNEKFKSEIRDVLDTECMSDIVKEDLIKSIVNEYNKLDK
jgi:hypothetical protein